MPSIDMYDGMTFTTRPKGKPKKKHVPPKWPVKPKRTCWKGYKLPENVHLIEIQHTNEPTWSCCFRCCVCGTYRRDEPLAQWYMEHDDCRSEE